MCPRRGGPSSQFMSLSSSKCDAKEGILTGLHGDANGSRYDPANRRGRRSTGILKTNQSFKYLHKASDDSRGDLQ